jgi:exopolyphosphatase/guanosine-5'-triphosphate,3'-diphosphate pyrophosphatase
LREGLLSDAMPSDLRGMDPLVAGCAALGSRRPVAEALGAALEAWASPVFAKLEPLFGRRDTALLAAACRLAELGAQLHPDHRAQLVFQQVLRAPIAGLTHPERVFLACAAFHRHTAAEAPEAALVERLLDPERQQRARAIGATLRLGCDLSGRSPELLARTRLGIERGRVVLQADEDWRSVLLGDQTTKRAQAAAALLEREPRIRPAA